MNQATCIRTLESAGSSPAAPSLGRGGCFWQTGWFAGGSRGAWCKQFCLALALVSGWALSRARCDQPAVDGTRLLLLLPPGFGVKRRGSPRGFSSSEVHKDVFSFIIRLYYW